MALIVLLSACLVATSTEQVPRELVVIAINHLPPAQQVLALTMQGLANRTAARVWIEDGGMQAVILRDLEQAGTSVRRVLSPWDLLPLLGPDHPSAIAYHGPGQGVTVAIALCAARGAVAVDESLRSEALDRGLTIIADASGWDEARVWREHQRDFARGIMVEQDPRKTGHLLDLAVARRAFTTFGQPDAVVTQRVKDLGPDTQVFGWGDDELAIVSRVSAGGGSYLPADWSRNLSALQHLPTAILLPPRAAPGAQVMTGERLVTFVMSDGDNLQFLGGPFSTSPGHWGSPLRGSFTMTWEIAPLLATCAPRVMAKLYGAASHGQSIDDFVSGPSGAGYCFPALLPDRRRFAEYTVAHLRASRLRIVSVLNAGGDMTQTRELLEQPDVLGVIYKDYAPYNAKQGALWWHQGKPCMAYRFLLWEGLLGQDPEGVAAAIGKLPAEPATDPASYVLINVHAWSYKENGGPMAAVQRTIARLPSSTRVVGASELFTQLRQHFGVPVLPAP